MRILRGLVCLLLVASLYSLRAAEDAPKIEFVPAEFTFPISDWYGIYGPDGKKIGFAHMHITESKEGTPSFVNHMTMHMQMKAMGNEIRMDMDETEVFDAQPPYQVRSSTATIVQGPTTQKVHAERGDKGMDLTIEQGGKSRTLKFDPQTYSMTDVVSQTIWLKKQKPAVGAKLSVQHADLSEGVLSTDTYTVASVKEVPVNGVPVTYFELQVSSSKFGDVGLARSDAEGKLLSAKIGGLLEMRLEPEDQAKDIGVSSDLFVLSQALVDKPLGNPKDITHLVLEASGPPVGKIPNGPCQSVEKTDQANVVIVRMGTKDGKPAEATKEEFDEALTETAEYPVKDAQVIALAKEAVGDAKTDREKVDRLVHFVYKYVEPTYSVKPTTVFDILKTRKGDCTVHTLLFTALARAAGIPARPVQGLIYMGDKFKAFGGHAWNEVALDGHWVPVDSTWDEVEVNACHLSFGSDKHGMGTFVALIGQIKLKLKEVELRK